MIAKQLEEMTEDDLANMQLHEVVGTAWNSVMRVPGGWLYKTSSTMENGADLACSDATTFVPFPRNSRQ